MTDPERDIDSLLQAANPVSEEQLPMPSDSPAAQLLYEQITGTPYAGSSRRSSRRRWLGPGLATLVAVTGIGTVAAYSLANHLTSHLTVACYAKPDLEGHALAVNADSDGPVAACSRAWADGRFGTGTVPQLVACLAPEGVASVFPSAPGADVCGQLGLPALPAGAATLDTTPTTAAPPTTANPESLTVALRDAVVADLQASCLTDSQAELTIDKLFAKAEIKWTVITPTPFPPGRPCASPGFDEAKHQVVITGIPPASP